MLCKRKYVKGDPTPFQIEQLCLVMQKNWTEEEKEERYIGKCELKPLERTRYRSRRKILKPNLFQ